MAALLRTLRGPGARIAVACGLAIAVVAVYGRTGHFPFVPYDDQGYVYENALVRQGLSWSTTGWALSALEFSNWHPLTWLSYLVDVSLYGVNPGALHFENAVLHAANAVLVFAVLTRSTGAHWRSAFVAALFALHPTRIESVAWISERKDLLFTFFGLLALLAYDAYVRAPSVRRYAGDVGAGSPLGAAWALGAGGGTATDGSRAPAATRVRPASSRRPCSGSRVR